MNRPGILFLRGRCYRRRRGAGAAFYNTMVGISPTASTLARYAGALNDMGTRDSSIQSQSFRVLAGLKYSIGSFDGDSAIGWSRNEVQNDNTNRLGIAGVSSAFGIGIGAQPPVPTATSSTYNLNNSSLNSAAVRDSIRANFSRKATSELFKL